MSLRALAPDAASMSHLPDLAGMAAMDQVNTATGRSNKWLAPQGLDESEDRQYHTGRCAGVGDAQGGAS